MGSAAGGSRRCLAGGGFENGFIGDVLAEGTEITALGALTSSTSSPSRFELLGALPDPFNPTTEIRFQLPEESPVVLRIYDDRGRVVRTLLREALAAGEHVVSWHGRADGGAPVGAGVYFDTLQAGDFTAREQLVPLKVAPGEVGATVGAVTDGLRTQSSLRGRVATIAL